MRPTKKSLQIVFIIALYFISLIAYAFGEAIKIFNSHDYTAVVQQHNKSSLIMIFWSIDCAPCLKEMRMISNLSNEERQHFVFISTDGHEFIDEISDLLTRLNLGNENNWVFNTEQSQQIIGTIDSSWYGETPRSYYFDENKNRSRLAHD